MLKSSSQQSTLTNFTTLSHVPLHIQKTVNMFESNTIQKIASKASQDLQHAISNNRTSTHPKLTRPTRPKLNSIQKPSQEKTYLTFNDRDVIFNQGDFSDLKMYEIITGEVTVHIGYSHINKQVATLQPSETFGEIAMMMKGKQRRTATCIAQGRTKLKVTASPCTTTLNNKRDLLDRRDLNRSALDLAGDQVEELNYEQDDVIVKQGDIGDCFYVLTAGVVDVTVNQKAAPHLVMNNSFHPPPLKVNTMIPGEVFGESALLSINKRRTANCVARGKCKILRIIPNSQSNIYQNRNIKMLQRQQQASNGTGTRFGFSPVIPSKNLDADAAICKVTSPTIAFGEFGSFSTTTVDATLKKIQHLEETKPHNIQPNDSLTNQSQLKISTPTIKPSSIKRNFLLKKVFQKIKNQKNQKNPNNLLTTTISVRSQVDLKNIKKKMESYRQQNEFKSIKKKIQNNIKNMKPVVQSRHSPTFLRKLKSIMSLRSLKIARQPRTIRRRKLRRKKNTTVKELFIKNGRSIFAGQW